MYFRRSGWGFWPTRTLILAGRGTSGDGCNRDRNEGMLTGGIVREKLKLGHRPKGVHTKHKFNRRDEDELLSTPTGFCMGVLGFPKLYDWQCDAMDPFLLATGKDARLTQVACVSPNEGGRSSLIIAGLTGWWLSMHREGKVAGTTADQKQLSEQILPAMDRDR